MRGYCAAALSDSSMADDAAQEVFIKAYQALSRFQGNAAFSTWIYRIAVNHCTDLLRKKIRHRTLSWEAMVEQQGDKAENHLTVQPDVERNEASELLDKILHSLPEKFRTVLVLREIHGLSYQEIAESLRCSLDAVKARLKRARREAEEKFRHLLKGTASSV